MSTTVGAVSTTNSGDETDFFYEYGDIYEINAIRTVVATAFSGSGMVSGPTILPHFLLSEWKVSGSAMRRIQDSICLPSGFEKGEYRNSLVK